MKLIGTICVVLISIIMFTLLVIYPILAWVYHGDMSPAICSLLIVISLGALARIFYDIL